MSYNTPLVTNPNVPRWLKFTKTFAELAAASTSNDIEVYPLPTNGFIHQVIMNVTTNFTGGLIAGYTLSVGVGGALTLFTSPIDAFTAPTFSGPSQAVSAVQSFSGTTSIRLSAVSSVGMLADATQGSVDVYILTSVLP